MVDLGGRWGCNDSRLGRFYFLGVFSRIHAGNLLGKVNQGKSCAAAGSPFSFFPSCGLWHLTCLSHARGTRAVAF